MESKDQYIKVLQDIYAFNVSKYSMSFRERLKFELGIVRVSTRATDDIKIMSREELEKALAEIKKPWWNWVFRIINFRSL